MKNNIIELSIKASREILALLKKPKEPNDFLKKAKIKYENNIKQT